MNENILVATIKGEVGRVRVGEHRDRAAISDRCAITARSKRGSLAITKFVKRRLLL